MFLAKVTDKAFGTMQPDGSVKLEIVDRLAWVIRMAPILCNPSGPGSPTTATTVRSTNCQFVVTVDANTAEALIGLESGMEPWPTDPG